MIARTSIIVAIILIAIKIYNVPKFEKKENDPLPNQIRCNQLEDQTQPVNEDYRSLSNSS